MKLLLFDIDGTMLHTHGWGRRAVERSISELLGRPVDTIPIRFSGKTDPQILHEVLVSAGAGGEAANELLSPALDRYAEIMRETYDPARITVLPGVADLVRHLHEQDDYALALVTGNLEPMAYLKLEAVGLASYFDSGAFGSDSADRSDLPPLAVERARKHTGQDFRGRDIVIVGDTEFDVRCGAGVGAFTIGVCTGNYTRQDLEPHGPDVILDDLSDAERFLAALA